MSRKVISLCLAVVFLLSGAVFASETDAVMLISANKAEVKTVKEIIKEERLVKYNVRIPEIQGLTNKAFEKKLNDTILNKAQGDIKSVEDSAKEFEIMAKKEGWEIKQYEIHIEYDVKSNADILSFVVNTYMYTGGANGITRVDMYNIDVKENKELTIKDLFLESVDYKEIINKEIISQIKKQIEGGGVDYFTDEMGFKAISEEQDFYLDNENLVVLFQKYDIAPGYMGTPEFKISLKTLGYLERNNMIFKYQSFTGVVKEIVEVDDKSTIYLEGKDGQPAYFVISNDTYIVDDAEIKAGSTVIGFYESDKPMILIYPPRYNIDVLAKVKDGENIKVDLFNYLVSSDNMLKLNMSNETKVILQDGTPFEEELENRKLVVIYGPSTKSIPAQTTPIKIIVLFEKAESPIYNFPSVSEAEIVVNDKIIQSPKAYTNENGFIMVPIRPICESLGLSVEWHNETQSVFLGNGISLTVGIDSYSKMKDIALGAAPELRDSRLYVPLDFFKIALIIDDATLSDGRIIIK